MSKMTLDKKQGTTEDNRNFGYVSGDGGGFFFTWMDTLTETLDSVDADEVDGDGGLDADGVKGFLKDELLKDFMTDDVRKIIEAKEESGEAAYLWLHDSGDCILWPNEEASEDDDGANAIERWQLAENEMDVLRLMGLVDANA
mgnify:FL=1